MLTKPHILVVDDDLRLCELLQKYLLEHNFEVTMAYHAEMARYLMTQFVFDALILDVMMPGETGLALTASLRQEDKDSLRIPILLLTAMGEVGDRINGLETGADDYLPKPFEPRELLARLRTILRRSTRSSREFATVQLGQCCFDAQRELLKCKGRSVRLTNIEGRLLKLLCKSPGKTFLRSELCDHMKISESSRAIDVQVARLRRKIEPDPKLPRYLQTVRNQGYVLWPD